MIIICQHPLCTTQITVQSKSTSNEEEVESRANLSPAPLEIPIVTPANDIFESDNSDSDLDFEGETEGKNILTEYLNTGKLPTRLHGVYLYPKAIMYITTHGLNIQMNPAHLTAWSQPELTKALPSSIFPIVSAKNITQV